MTRSLITDIMASLMLEGKITERHAEAIEEALNRLVETVYQARTEEVVKIAEGMTKDEVKWRKAKYDVKSVDAVLYNRALSDLITTLKDTKISKECRYCPHVCNCKCNKPPHYPHEHACPMLQKHED